MILSPRLFHFLGKPTFMNGILRSRFSEKRNYKIVDNPKDAPKLIFQNQGKCRIYQHKDGEEELKKIVRIGAGFTILNSLLTGLQFSAPIFGQWNLVSFSLCTGLGYLMMIVTQTLSKRAIKKIELHNDLQNVDVTFFNAFWKEKKVTYHISQFQEPYPSYANFIRVEITSFGKVWIKLEKNEFRNVKQYEQTLESILYGRSIENLNVVKKKNKQN